MLTGEGQAQRWMKAANRDDPEISKLQTRGQAPVLLRDRAQQSLTDFPWQPLGFPKTCWFKIQACTQKPREPVRDDYHQLQIIFKENSGLPMDVESIQVAFNSVFRNRLNWHLSLLVKRSRMEWETISTPDLVNLANQLTCTIENSTKRKTTEILSLQFQQMESPK